MKAYTMGSFVLVCALSVACSKKEDSVEVVQPDSATSKAALVQVQEDAAAQIAAAQAAAKTEVAEAQKQAAATMAAAKAQAETQVAQMKQQADAKVAAAQTELADKTAEYKDILANMTRPITEIKAQAEKMDVAELKQTAIKYKDLIASKSAEIAPLVAKLKEIPFSQMMGDKANLIKGQLAELKDNVTVLKSQYDVYAGKLQAMGVDLSSFIK